MNFHRGSLLRSVALAIGVSLLCSPVYGHPRTIDAASAQGSRFAQGQSAVRIPFEMREGGHIFLRVRVNGSEPLWFGLDSGLEQTIISLPQAKTLNLKLKGGMQAVGGGEGSVDFALTRNVAFDMPGVDFVLGEVGVIPMNFPGPVPGQNLAGILGYDFISRFVVEIEYAAHTMNLYKPRTYRYRGRGVSIPIRMMDSLPFVPLRVRLPGLRPLDGMFCIDSGSDSDLFFFSPFVRKHQLLKSKQDTIEASAIGIGGASKIRIGYATSVQIGRIAIANPVVHFSQASEGEDASDIGAGFIGGKFLRRFKIVIFDQTRRRLILEQNT